MQWILMIVYWFFLIGSLLTIPFNLSGTFLIAGFNLLYQLMDNHAGIDWEIVGILFAIAVILEAIEFGFTVWGSQKYGASRKGTVGAILGSIAGAILGAGIIPLLGALIGAFGGAFLGAFIFEYLRKRDYAYAVEVGKGALVGAVGGKLTKIIGAIAMLIVIGLHL